MQSKVSKKTNAKGDTTVMPSSLLPTIPVYSLDDAITYYQGVFVPKSKINSLYRLKYGKEDDSALHFCKYLVMIYLKGSMHARDFYPLFNAAPGSPVFTCKHLFNNNYLKRSYGKFKLSAKGVLFVTRYIALLHEQVELLRARLLSTTSGKKKPSSTQDDLF